MSDDLKLSDGDYLRAQIDETFAMVPQVKAHHDRMRAIAAKLDAAPQQAPGVIEADAIENLIGSAEAVCDRIITQGGIFEGVDFHAFKLAVVRARTSLATAPDHYGVSEADARDAALVQAREALDHYLHGGTTYRIPAEKAIVAIDAALAAQKGAEAQQTREAKSS